jgi:uncharacterized protein (TIGR00730 family)
MHHIQQVCVYCASSSLTPQVYLDAVDILAADLVTGDIKVVFGGGSTGLMGRLADQMLLRGGRIAGIMPDFMREVEWAHKSLTELQFVADMHERKKQFLVNTDALIALPGGSGTLEELLEAITWKRLGLFVKPIVILNLNGFYDPLLLQLERCVEEKFMTAAQTKMWTVVERPEEIVMAARNATVWSESLQNARVH